MSSNGPTEYLQEQFDRLYQRVAADAQRVKRERNSRRVIAYGLKIIAAVGGLVIAFGVPERVAHVLGFTIALVVLADTIFSNHRRLLSTAAATNAYAALLRTVRYQHQRKLAGILDQKQRDTDGAMNALHRLLGTLIKQLQDDSSAVEDWLAEEDIKALEALTVREDTER